MIRPLLMLSFLCLPAAWAIAQEGEQPAKFRKFEEQMRNAVLTGQFTVVGKKGELKEERYEIRSVKKEEGDFWVFDTRVKYGGKDQQFALPLPVKWVGDTPVVAMDEMTIPGMGTFSCRVVFDGDRYAGTWSHGEVKGHLFGTIAREQK